MRMIKEGDLSRLKDLRFYLAECPKCGCVFEFNWNEATHYYGYESSHSVECPTCIKVIDLVSDYVKMIEK